MMKKNILIIATIFLVLTPYCNSIELYRAGLMPTYKITRKPIVGISGLYTSWTLHPDGTNTTRTASINQNGGFVLIVTVIYPEG